MCHTHIHAGQKKRGDNGFRREENSDCRRSRKSLRDAVSAYLERENYVVKGVGDGQSAVEELKSMHLTW